MCPRLSTAVGPELETPVAPFILLFVHSLYLPLLRRSSKQSPKSAPARPLLSRPRTHPIITPSVGRRKQVSRSRLRSPSRLPSTQRRPTPDSHDARPLIDHKEWDHDDSPHSPSHSWSVSPSSCTAQLTNSREGRSAAPASSSPAQPILAQAWSKCGFPFANSWDVWYCWLP